ncbi:hypothetical protein ACFQGT_13500 [Natrialbaceae archaeon GCM10025810]|uniref:hypothetical protein n=1 Tax=Halovalidus salilacus TaxID=3075124 RepID=UPI0036063A08
MVPDDPPPDDSEPGSGPRLDGGPDRFAGTPRPFTRHVSRIVDRFDSLLPFALVPFVTTLIDLERVERATAMGGRAVSITLEFALPSPLLDLWSFVDPSTSGSGSGFSGGGSAHVPGGDPFGTPARSPERVGPTGPTTSSTFDVTVETPTDTVAIPVEALTASVLVWIALVLLLYAALGAVLQAVYLGGLDRRLRDEPVAAVECVIAYAPRLFLYDLTAFAAVLLVVTFAVVSPAMVVLAIPAGLLLGYLFYAVPFLFVVDDAPFLEAFRRSYRLAFTGPYVRFALAHALVSAAASLVLSVLVSGGASGFILGLLLAVPLSLVLTAATVSFVQDLTGDRPGSVRSGSAPASGLR